VIEHDKQLEGERKQRTPRSKLQVRSNPAHSASITSRLEHVATLSKERQTSPRS
jgi:hypothetical protein